MLDWCAESLLRHWQTQARRSFDTDRLMEISAPGIGNDGAAYLEFNLSDPDLGFSLDFLSYDWRDDPHDELDDITEDFDYRDNPRSSIRFWQLSWP